ncbi:hypothetical protein K2X05_10440, partial [bacterium]|nr:hypothetical protein [bacterium]
MGEYLALTTGPSLLVASQPSFEFDFQVGDMSRVIHPQSPAGLWYQKKSSDIGSLQINMIDPHGGEGGFGASTAQFLAVWLYAQAVQKKSSFSVDPKMALQCWQDYRSLFSQTVVPSGADVINQICGGVMVWDPSKQEILRLEWPFPDVKLHLFKTSYKIKTHEHLSSLDIKKIPQEALLEIMQIAVQAVREKNSGLFLKQSIAYSKELEKAGLQASETTMLIKQISQLPDVIGVRGCGALGADVMAVYTLPQADLDLSEFDLKKKTVLPEQISSGPVWRWS